MSELGKIEVEIRDLAGVAKPFPQGGVWRLTIPKKIIKKYNLNAERKIGRYFAFIFLDTDKGLLLLPLPKVVNPENIRQALMKFVDLSYMSDEDLQIVFEEE